ncbi:unnamed protein product [Musa acuminata var. zebrina]
MTARFGVSKNLWGGMAGDQGNCSVQGIGESSDSTIELNVKMLDSRVYTFRVNKDTPVPSLKAKVASATGVPVELQRLIFRGKVLKDDHHLSDYYLDDGHTLHLVARQPVQAQTQPGTVAGDSSRVNDNQGSDSTSNAPHNRIGQVSHSVVLGTVNIGDQGEGVISDIGRVVGAVLQSLGGGILTPGVGASNTPSAANQVSPGGETEGSRNVNGRNQLGNQTQPAVTVVNQPFQVQLASPGSVPRNMVIPDSMTTLLDFINRMELILQNSGSQSSSPSNLRDPPRSDNASLNVNRLPTPDVLASVIEHARLLLSGNAAAAFSRMVERLRRETTSADPMIRSQIQSDAMHMGLVMQHLGAMLLELGRTTMMLRMGPSPDGSFVNSGPAVYISSTGPNPIMVQPFPPQMSPLFTASSPLVNGPSMPLAGGDPLRNINIHILSGTSLAPGVLSSGGRANTGDANRSERQNVEQPRQNGSGSGNADPMRGIPARTVVAAIPARPSGETASQVLSVVYPVHVRSQQSGPPHSGSFQGSHPPVGSGMEPNTSVIVPHPSESGSIPAIVAQVNAHIDGAFAGNALGQSSSFTSQQAAAAQGSHPAMNSESQSDMNVQLPQGSSGMDSISAIVRQINEQIANVISGNSPNQSSSSTAGQQQVAAGSLSTDTDDNFASTHDDNDPDSNNKLFESQISDTTTRGDGKQPQLEGNGFSTTGDHQRSPNLEESSTAGLIGLTSCGSDTNSATLGKFAEKTLMSGVASHDSSSSQASGSGRSTPLGLGLGGLQPKRRSKSTKPVGKDRVSCDATSVNQNQESISRGQEILRSIVSRSSDVNRVNVNSPSTSLPSVLGQFVDGMSLGGQGSQEQVDAGGMISHVLQSPVFNNLLANVAGQTGLGSPADLRSMMEQCTQSPAMRSALNNIVQQVEGEGQDHGSMLLGSGSSEGGIDFSRMIQQMMPMVSQALGRVSSRSPPVTVMGSEHQPQSNNVTHNVERMQDRNVQIDLREARERIEQCDSSGNIFRAMLEGSGNLYGEEMSYEDLQELGDDAELGNEYLEMLQRHIRERLHKQSNSSEKS